MLEALHWTCEDVYGRDALDRQYLAWKVKGQRIGPVTSIGTVLRGADGSVSRVYRRIDQMSGAAATAGLRDGHSCAFLGHTKSGTPRPLR